MLLVHCLHLLVPVARRKWVEKPHIQKCVLMCIPETSALYIHSGCIVHARTLPRSTSPVSGCSDGSILTFWVTSPSSEVVTSLISLCHLITLPPLQQLRACSTPFALPQAQRLGIPVGHHPYLKARASRKAPLFRAKPFSSTGRVLNHEDDPFCSAKDRAFLSFAVTSLCTPSALLWCISLLSFFISLESAQFCISVRLIHFLSAMN